MMQATKRMPGTGAIRGVVALALAWLVLATSGLAHAYDPALSQDEIARLERGEHVTRPDTLEDDGRRWIGGVSYAIVDAPPNEVGDVLENVESYREILPKVRELRWIAISRAGDAIIEIEQGTSIAHGRYTIGVRRERESRGVEMVRFWVDLRFRRDIADARGWFRLEPIPGGRTLISYVIMIDLGPGLFKRLFEDKIRGSALRPPLLVRRYFEARPRG